MYRTMFLSPLVDSEEVEGKVLEMGEGEAFWWTPAQQCHVLILNTGERCRWRVKHADVLIWGFGFRVQCHRIQCGDMWVLWDEDLMDLHIHTEMCLCRVHSRTYMYV